MQACEHMYLSYICFAYETLAQLHAKAPLPVQLLCCTKRGAVILKYEIKKSLNYSNDTPRTTAASAVIILLLILSVRILSSFCPGVNSYKETRARLNNYGIYRKTIFMSIISQIFQYPFLK